MSFKYFTVDGSEKKPTDRNSKGNTPAGLSKDQSKLSLKGVLKSLGPGVVTGAADDDPSGIATYSQAGASFGFGMLWMVIFQYPLMTAVQEMCARIGLLTGGGLAGVIKKKYSNKVVLPLASLLLIANTINIGADIGAMGAAIKLLIPQIPFVIPTLIFTAIILLVQIFVPYRKYVKVLKYMTISLFAYIVTAIIVGGNAQNLALATLIPHFEFNSNFAMMFVAMFGTTISPYLFFWQTSEEVEEEVKKKKIPGMNAGKPEVTTKEVKLMKVDVAIGMFFSQLIMWSIIVTTAGSLHSQGITDVQTAEQVAKSLEPAVKSFPYSGEIAKIIFSLGIIGTGLLAVPVLAGSSAYALSDAFGWKQGLFKKFRQAKAFYLVIAASTIIGLWINFTSIDPVKALIYAAVINGVTAVPILFVIMRIANDKKILGKRVNNRLSNILGWTTVALMAASVTIMFSTFYLQTT